MEKQWKKNLLSVRPYVAGEQPSSGSFIKLNANENPYPPSPSADKALHGFDAACLKKYPDASARGLREKLAARYGLTPNEVFAGNGSDEVLALSFRAFFNSEMPILFPDITYSFYPVWCEMLKIKYKTVPVGEDLRIRPEDYFTENGGIVIANPNAPTSIGEGGEFVEGILKANPDSVVIIDEAYADFGEYTAVPLIKDFDNLLVVRTMSKSRSLAGMRVGAAFGSAELIAELEAVKDCWNSYPLDSIAQAVAAASLDDEEYFIRTVNMIKSTREKVSKKLSDLGFMVMESSTNFLFCTHGEISASDIYGKLRSKGIYVRHFSLPRIDNYLRITIGTDEEMSELTNALETIVK